LLRALKIFSQKKARVIIMDPNIDPNTVGLILFFFFLGLVFISGYILCHPARITKRRRKKTP